MQDLSARDEDGHTPLHDCLQQVYFESDNSEEKCTTFFKVWYTMVEKAVQWWCMKQAEDEPQHGQIEYLKLQRKAMYYLRSCVKNNDNLSALQFAADRGLVTWVQTMLSTKNVFVLPCKEASKGKPIHYKIDVTNLCPEYFVRISEAEETTTSIKYQTDGGRTSFLHALAEVKPPDKAGKILESIPMRSLCRLEWRVSQLIHLLWMIVNLVLIILAAVEIRTTDKDSMDQSALSIALGIIILMYITVITSLQLMVKLLRFRRQRKNRKNGNSFIAGSIEHYSISPGKEGVFDCIMPATAIFDEVVFLTELTFARFAWAVYIRKMANFDRSLFGSRDSSYCLDS